MTTGCPPAFALERLHARERWPGVDALFAHVAGCADCSARLRELAAEDSAFKAASRPFAARLGEAPRPAPRPRWTFALASVAVAALVVMVLPRPGPELTPKGGGLSLVLSRGGTQVEWRGEALAPGDLLQPLWTSAAPAQGVLVALEPDGGVQVLFPPGPSSVELTAGQSPLGPSIVVDELTSSHELWLFHSTAPFEVEAARQAAARRAPTSFAGEVTRVPLTPR